MHALCLLGVLCFDQENLNRQCPERHVSLFRPSHSAQKNGGAVLKALDQPRNYNTLLAFVRLRCLALLLACLVCRVFQAVLSGLDLTPQLTVLLSSACFIRSLACLVLLLLCLVCRVLCFCIVAPSPLD